MDGDIDIFRVGDKVIINYKDLACKILTLSFARLKKLDEVYYLGQWVLWKSEDIGIHPARVCGLLCEQGSVRISLYDLKWDRITVESDSIMSLSKIEYDRCCFDNEARWEYWQLKDKRKIERMLAKLKNM